MNTPLSRKNMNLTNGWKYSSGLIHAGYDYGVQIHTPVFAVRDGHILETVDNIPNLDPDKEGQSGDPPNYILQGIMYKHEAATVVYLHVSPNVPVKAGDEVQAGQQIARSGHNGHSTGPHLHVSVLKGHNHLEPFDYLQRYQPGEDLEHSPPPRPGGLASNGLTIFPPRLVYSRQQPTALAGGTIVLEDLTFGTMHSDSVRRLQHRLNGIHLEHGAELPVTGNYLDLTRAEVTKWQVQKRHAEPGTVMANGNLHANQAQILFGKRFTLVHRP
jgi:Peptidase family M23